MGWRWRETWHLFGFIMGNHTFSHDNHLYSSYILKSNTLNLRANKLDQCSCRCFQDSKVKRITSVETEGCIRRHFLCFYICGYDTCMVDTLINTGNDWTQRENIPKGKFLRNLYKPVSRHVDGKPPGTTLS